jgi:hypothetical protein
MTIYLEIQMSRTIRFSFDIPIPLKHVAQLLREGGGGHGGGIGGH